MPRPKFSIVITSYERAEMAVRCVESCLAQGHESFEVVVVDDASTDDTVARLDALGDERLAVVAHPANRGINPSRHTGVEHASGDWIVALDSDWELLPGALWRLDEIIAGLPPGVRVVRSRLLWDDGRVTPTVVPDRPLTYVDRIEWVEREGGFDAARCIHRDVFETTPYFRDRRGAMETLFELNLARNETTLVVADTLTKMYTTASNSYLRSVDRRELIPRLLRDAPDMLWMSETTISNHGPALREHGPRQHRIILRVATVSAFLCGERRRGVLAAWRYLKTTATDVMLWGTLVLGLFGPRAVAYGTLAQRRLAAVRERGA